MKTESEVIDRILTLAEPLSLNDQKLLIGELKCRLREQWLTHLDADIKQVREDLRAGRLKPEPAEVIIARLMKSLDRDEDEEDE